MRAYRWSQLSGIASECAVWQEIGILVGGYGFILMSYAWVWMLAVGMSRYVSGERLRFGRADAQTLAGILAFWTLTWSVMLLMGCSD